MESRKNPGIPWETQGQMRLWPLESRAKPELTISVTNFNHLVKVYTVHSDHVAGRGQRGPHDQEPGCQSQA